MQPELAGTIRPGKGRLHPALSVVPHRLEKNQDKGGVAMLDLTTEAARQTSPGQLTDIELESWLEPAPEPARRVIWRPAWGQAVPVRSIEHLTVVMSATALEDFGGLCLDGDDGSR